MGNPVCVHFSERTAQLSRIAAPAFGNRVAKTVNGVTTQYLVEDDVNPTGLPQVVEETVNGVVTRSYTYGLERISHAQPINGAWTPLSRELVVPVLGFSCA